MESEGTPPQHDSGSDHGSGEDVPRSDINQAHQVPEATLSKRLVRHRRRTPRQKYLALAFFTVAYSVATIVLCWAAWTAYQSWY